MKKDKKITTRQKLGAEDHLTPFEKHLDLFLEKYPKPQKLSVRDIKDIVWNESGGNLISRMTFMLHEANIGSDINEIMNTLSEAWNNFAHKSRNGLSPRELVQRFETNPDFDYEERPTFFDIFNDQFPKESYLRKADKNNWEWQHSGKIQKLKETLDMIGGEASADDEKAEFVEEIFEPFNIEFLTTSLKENPLFFSGAVWLARHKVAISSIKEARQILEHSIATARALVPIEFKTGKDKMPWGFLDNRPFLTLLSEYAMLVEEVDGKMAAIPLYEEIISLNPNDNQGIRSLLATAYLATNQLENLFLLDKKYPDDLVAELSMGTVLGWIKKGEFELAKKRIQKYKKHWGNLFTEILKINHSQPKLQKGRVTVGGEDEAWLYWCDQGTFWMTTKGAQEFLKECIS